MQFDVVAHPRLNVNSFVELWLPLSWRGFPRDFAILSPECFCVKFDFFVCCEHRLLNLRLAKPRPTCVCPTCCFEHVTPLFVTMLFGGVPATLPQRIRTNLTSVAVCLSIGISETHIWSGQIRQHDWRVVSAELLNCALFLSNCLVGSFWLALCGLWLPVVYSPWCGASVVANGIQMQETGLLQIAHQVLRQPAEQNSDKTMRETQRKTGSNVCCAGNCSTNAAIDFFVANEPYHNTMFTTRVASTH